MNVARGTVRSDLNYIGPVNATLIGEATDIHFSNRFHRDRQYRFHLCDVQLPQVDLYSPQNQLKQSIHRHQPNRRTQWLTITEMNNPINRSQCSPTLPAILDSLKYFPIRQIPQPMRRSEGGIALIQRTIAGKRQWLAQWNDNWDAFFFIGGHRIGNETYRECVIREIEEELNLNPAECPVDNTLAYLLEYRAISRSAHELTAYTMVMFNAHPTLASTDKITRNTKNKWISDAEIHRLETDDYRSISITMRMLLQMAGVI